MGDEYGSYNVLNASDNVTLLTVNFVGNTIKKASYVAGVRTTLALLFTRTQTLETEPLQVCGRCISSIVHFLLESYQVEVIGYIR